MAKMQKNKKNKKKSNCYYHLSQFLLFYKLSACLYISRPVFITYVLTFY